MKKLIIVIVITLLATTSAQSQFFKSFGFKAGTSIANQSYTYPSNSIVVGQESDPNDALKYKFGFTIGVFKEIPINQYFKTQIGINYARKGSLVEKIETNGFGVPTGYKYFAHYNVDFITAELYARYDFSKGKTIPYALAGIRFDYYLTQHAFSRNHGVETDLAIGLDITNNKIFGASFGAGVEFLTTKQFSIFLEATYNPDFTFITNDIIRGRSFDIRTGIKF